LGFTISKLKHGLTPLKRLTDKQTVGQILLTNKFPKSSSQHSFLFSTFCILLENRGEFLGEKYVLSKVFHTAYR